jgi:hypothetical protein
VGRFSTTHSFIFIGADPCTEWLDGQFARNDDGFLLTSGELDVTHLDVDPTNGGRPVDAAGDEPARRPRRRRRPHRLDQPRRLGGRGVTQLSQLACKLSLS